MDVAPTVAPILPTVTPVPPPAAPRAQSDKPRRLADVAQAEMRALAVDNNAFAFDLYQVLRSEEGNLLFSPFSISQALAMVYAGARGETAQQMADTLHYTSPQELLHPRFNAVDRMLASDSQGTGPEETGFTLHLANALWGQERYPFRAEYLDTMAQNYGAGLYLIDFRTAGSAVVAAIKR